ncbi:uncharacterized protein LOC126844028 isoform X2 [Adelges cooleyi]|uniref:uncharacterized protein LOC126844028 isoform X2 n=1 Tax=Adelges cooleyi TaxID=133065 RepID=UPI00217F8180|nr:uncharacterized protein LOC126844028 isoform X2 [Adelges cooleyi]
MTDRYNFAGISFPTPLSEVKKFEKNNKEVSINVYGFKKGNRTYKNKAKNNIPNHTNEKKDYIIIPYRVCTIEQPNHFDLLYFDDGKGNFHYCYIRNLTRLVGQQMSKNNKEKAICRRCFKTYVDEAGKAPKESRLDEHRRICNKNESVTPILPPPKTYMKFENYGNTQKHDFVIYADFECLLKKPAADSHFGKTTVTQDHVPMSYVYLVKPSEDVPKELLDRFNIPQTPVVYSGNKNSELNDVPKHFIQSITDVARNIEQLLNVNTPIRMSTQDDSNHKAVVNGGQCPLCNCKFSILNHPVRDHHHLSGRYRNTVCNRCNLKMQSPTYVSCIFHNLSSYDSHIIVTELGHDPHTINVIPNSEEKFISFSKFISNKFSVRFLDSYRFMASSLDKLTNNLARSDKSKFRSVLSAYGADDIDLVTRKGVYCYEYTDSWEKLEEPCLPPIEQFYSSLTESNISQNDYDHAVKVFNHFKFKTLGDYSLWYNELDVHILCDVFESFRELCITTYSLDPCFYYTLPGYSFDVCLKHTKVELELLSDYDMLLMFENGIRGGLTQASKRYSKANHAKTPQYNPAEPNSWIIYLDATNLYGWAMSQALPLGNFKWYEGDHSVHTVKHLLKKCDKKSKTGLMLEVDIEYPRSLHDKHSDLPFMCERLTPAGSRIKKLVATLQNKQRYIVHHSILKQALEAGLILKKVHRILSFDQSPWLGSYISLNTEMRKKAINDFQKDFFKLMNNAVFGKTMENVRNRMKMSLVCSPESCQRLINKPTFKGVTQYSENLYAVHLNKDVLTFDKPVYVGFSVLEISKTLMYDFHYNVMKEYYGCDIELLYMDTDSLMYLIKTKDFYADVLSKPGFLEKLDTSNFPPSHPCYRTERKKVPGTFTDETGGDIIWEQIALRAKSYGYILMGAEHIKAKGVAYHVIKNHMTFEDHKDCLFQGINGKDPNSFNPYRTMNSFRSYKHDIKSISTVKLALNRNDDKRVVLADRIHTLPYGHYKLE